MPKFRIKVEVKKFEFYEVEAANADEATENYNIDGKLYNTSEDEESVVGIYPQ